MTDSSPRQILLGIGNIYVETLYLNVKTGNADVLSAGREYAAGSYVVQLGGSVPNCIRQAKRLGAAVGLIGKCGTDKSGDELFELLISEGIATDFIIRSPDVQTSVDTGVMLSDVGENIQLVAGNSNRSFAFTDIELDSPYFDAVAAVYLGGSRKQALLFPYYPKLLKILSAKNIRLFLDHGRIPVDVNTEQRAILFESLPFIEVYLPNINEILGITQARSLDDALNQVLRLGVRVIAVKLGKEGCRIKTKELDFTVPSFPVEIVSTVGAGDTFNAGFITQYLAGKDLKYCAGFGNAVAALFISSNSQPDYQKVINLLKRG